MSWTELHSSSSLHSLVPVVDLELCEISLDHVLRCPNNRRPSAAWLERLAQVGDTVVRVAAVRQSCEEVRVGDLLLAVNGELVNSVLAVEAKLSESTSVLLDTIVKATLFSHREHQTIVRMSLFDRAEVLLWHGLVLQHTPRVLWAVRGVSMIHITRTLPGSPAETSSVEGDFIIGIDGELILTMQALLEYEETSEKVCALLNTQRSLCLKTADLAGRQYTSIVDADPSWPTQKIGAGSCKIAGLDLS